MSKKYLTCLESKQQRKVLEPGFEIWIGICQAEKKEVIYFSGVKCLRLER